MCGKKIRIAAVHNILQGAWWKNLFYLLFVGRF